MRLLEKVPFAVLSALLIFTLPEFSVAESVPNASQCCAVDADATGPPVQSSMSGFFSNLFNTSSYPPRWNCGTWTPLEGWLHIVSDLGIFIAYFSIPLSLMFFIRKRTDVPFHSIFLLFAAFILLCGATHLVEAIIFYYPIYRIAGLLKLVTAVVSLATLAVLIKLIPKALELPGLLTKNEILMRADEVKSEFIANMSHEIRTPMTAILGFAETLEDESISTEEKDRAIQTIRRNGNHLLQLINDILDLSKVESGKLKLEQRQVCVSDLLSDLRSMLKNRAEINRNKLDIRIRGNVPETIQSDPTRLKQALVNLVGNAIKFTEDGTIDVWIECEAEQEQMRFNVVDSGIGMTAEQLENIFVPFGQADASTTRKYGGTGLGLTITKQIAEQLGGEVLVESTLGKGSSFTLSIATGPLTGVRMLSHLPEQSEFKDESRQQQAVTARKTIQGRVLLVEDGPDNQRLISHILRKSGAEVTIAENGKVGVDVALSQLQAGEAFGVVLMDMQMPVMDGYEATARLREAGYPGQIIALTAHAMKGESDRCLKAGCDAYLSKPIDRAIFLEEVSTRMAKTSEHHQLRVESDSFQASQS